MAEGGGFEPPVNLRPRRFSKPFHSAALAPFRPTGYRCTSYIQLTYKAYLGTDI